GVDDQRTNVELFAQLVRSLGLCRIDLGRAPHARAGGKNLQCICTDFRRSRNGVGDTARGAQMYTDSQGHTTSLPCSPYVAFYRLSRSYPRRGGHLIITALAVRPLVRSPAPNHHHPALGHLSLVCPL